jgi:hypothetical protein
MKKIKNHHRRTIAGGKKTAKSSGGRKWSAGVTKHSNALDLEKGVFTSGSQREIERKTRKRG